MIRVFKSELLRCSMADSELAKLVQDFKDYKQQGVVPQYFGRDVGYDHPNTLSVLKQEQVQHLHLLDLEVSYAKYTLQYYKTSDVHLVYCQGYFEEQSYLLMAILRPDAHQQARDRQLMLKLGRMAELFRQQY